MKLIKQTGIGAVVSILIDLTRSGLKKIFKNKEALGNAG